jgi:hypothetical protein
MEADRQVTNKGDKQQVKVWVAADLALAFKDACSKTDTSMASILARCMENYANTKQSVISVHNLSTRRQRRSAVKRIIVQLEKIRENEVSYRDRIPETLQGSEVYERAEELIAALDEAIDQLALW